MAYQYELVLFDLDGTLTDSGLGIMNSVQYALKKIGRGVENLEELKCFVGPPLALTDVHANAAGYERIVGQMRTL